MALIFEYASFVLGAMIAVSGLRLGFRIAFTVQESGFEGFLMLYFERAIITKIIKTGIMYDSKWLYKWLFNKEYSGW